MHASRQATLWLQAERTYKLLSSQYEVLLHRHPELQATHPEGSGRASQVLQSNHRFAGSELALLGPDIFGNMGLLGLQPGESWP